MHESARYLLVLEHAQWKLADWLVIPELLHALLPCTFRIFCVENRPTTSLQPALQLQEIFKSS